MRIVKIVQDSETGKVGIQVKHDQKYDMEEHLQLLTEFATEKAVETHELRKSHNELVMRLGKCEEKLSELSEELKAD